MCGIVGYIGTKQAAGIILDGLDRLEYRGYDSAGMAVYDGEQICTQKAAGRLQNLREITQDGRLMPGRSGIGHTRWATHGAPSHENSHPHLNEKRTIAVVHNGIIENYLPLKKKLQNKGYMFRSETDTEVLAHLLDYYDRGNPLETITKVMERVEGSYALGILFASHPDILYAVRKDSPLIIGRNEDGCYLASDVPAVLKYTDRIWYPDDREVVVLRSYGPSFFTIDEEEVKREPVKITWNADEAQKNGYEHFMLKEIMEQPKAFADTVMPRIKGDEIVWEQPELMQTDWDRIRRICIVGCGSAYHAGVSGKYVIEALARIPTDVETAGEFRYRDPVLEPGTVVLVISQSGETADSIAALRLAKERGCPVWGIVNVPGSSIAREADRVLYTWAGPEIAVATTKAYSAQLGVLYLVALYLAKLRKTISQERFRELLEELRGLPKLMRQLLGRQEEMQRLAMCFAGKKDIFFVGRGPDYAVSLEASLKLKEISYLHSEGYAAGELKHGTISLIENGTVVIAVATQPKLYPKVLSNVTEVCSRGAFVLCLTGEENNELQKVCAASVTLLRTDPLFMPSLVILPLQLLAYYVAVDRGCDVDKPRNLAKSVTVE